MPAASQFDEFDECDAIWDLLNLYADGEATPEQVEEIESLLASSESYRCQLHLIKASGSLVQSFSEVEPPNTLRASILNATTRRQPWHARVAAWSTRVTQSWSPRPAFTLGGLAAACLLCLYLLPHTTGGNSVPAAHPGVAVASLPGAEIKVTPSTGSMDDRHPVTVVSTSRHSIPPMVRMKSPLDNQSGAVHAGSIVAKASHGDPGVTRAGLDANKPDNGSDDSAPMQFATNFRPGMDMLNQRPAPASSPADAAASDLSEQTVQHVDLADTTASTSPAPGDADPAPIDPPHSAHSAGAPRVIVAHLSALPPDPNQVLTRADMARNHAAQMSGYDRLTLKSLERKEASVSFYKGTF